MHKNYRKVLKKYLEPSLSSKFTKDAGREVIVEVIKALDPKIFELSNQLDSKTFLEFSDALHELIEVYCCKYGRL